EQFRATYEEKFTSMREDLRQEVAKFERNRANAHSRERRNVTADHLAATCNTLAWLLGNCERDTEDAVSLAERAVALAGEEPAYLDTLGRCYFSAGRYDEALATQSKAVRLQPSNRLMVAQLEEFLKKAEGAGANQP
ncbi:MAG: tetratricopeptide repeat protein, partial [Planctomycetota bacterium]